MNPDLKENLSNFQSESRNNFSLYFEKLSDKRGQLAEIKHIADEERERIAAWEYKESATLKNEAEYLETAITEEYKTLLAENPKAKCTTPWGKATKRTATKWQYGDETALLSNLKGIMPELVKSKTVTTESIDKPELKKTATVLDDGRVTIDGEILEGVTAMPETTINIETEEK